MGLQDLLEIQIFLQGISHFQKEFSQKNSGYLQTKQTEEETAQGEQEEVEEDLAFFSQVLHSFRAQVEEVEEVGKEGKGVKEGLEEGVLLGFIWGLLFCKLGL
jgi:hypothetical protein